jgi:hypothetical protein
MRILFLALSALVAIALAVTGQRAQTVHACSVLVGPFDFYTSDADVVVLAQVVSAGGPGNLAPTVTPTPAGTPSPFVPRDPQGTPIFSQPDVELTGIGARVRVIEAVDGESGREFDVDASRRRAIELKLREREADANFQYPCPLDLGVPRFVAGQAFLLFLSRDGDGGLTVEARMRVEGGNVMLGGPGELVQELTMSTPVYRSYFSHLAAEEQKDQLEEPRFSGGSLWTVESKTVPVERVISAVRGTRSGNVYSGRPGGLIMPPDTGSGGLK